MKILGIDPGLSNIGWGIVEFPDLSAATTAYGHVATNSRDSLAIRLRRIHETLVAVIAEHRPEAAAIEEIFFAKNVRTAVSMAHGRGAAVLSLAQADVEMFEYSPLQIKQAVVGYGRASKEQVQMMVKTLLGLKQAPNSEHAADALAAALCHAATLKRRALLNKAGR